MTDKPETKAPFVLRCSCGTERRSKVVPTWEWFSIEAGKLGWRLLDIPVPGRVPGMDGYYSGYRLYCPKCSIAHGAIVRATAVAERE